MQEASNQSLHAEHFFGLRQHLPIIGSFHLICSIVLGELLKFLPDFEPVCLLMALKLDFSEMYPPAVTIGCDKGGFNIRRHRHVFRP